jgi:predicted Zn finger-like uncharacterized protein
MIVRCANCQTEFSLDDRRVGPEGAPVRCSVCGYVFRVDPPAGAATDQPWQIRTVEDLLFTSPDLGTLRAWIGEGRLHPDDHVSRTGKHWVRLGDMSEFADAFAEFQELPRVVEPVAQSVEATSERSAVDALGPPPAFGTGTSESSGPSVMAAVAPLAETHTEQLNVAIADARSRDEAAPQALSRTASEGIVVGHVGTHEPPKPPKPPPPVPPKAADAKPASMLDAVSRNVQPIRASSLDVSTTSKPAAQIESGIEPGQVDRGKVEPEEVDPAESLSQTLPRGQRTAEPVADALELEPRKRSLWPVLTGLGLVAAAAAVFGVPELRERVLGTVPSASTPDPPVATLELPSVISALSSADPLAIGKAEAELQSRIDAGGESPSNIATIKLAQVELLTTRSLTFALVAGLDASAENASKHAADDAARAAGIFEEVNPDDVVERDRIRTARARLRLVEGRPAEEIVALLPEGADELRHVVTGAPLWRDADARVPEGVISGLEALEQPSVTGRLVLALAYVRSGDREGASRVVDGVLLRSPAQPAALALQAALREGSDAQAKKDEPESDATPKADVVADAGATKDAGATQDAGATKEPKKSGGATKATTAGLSVDRLIDRGCELVDSGKSSEGIEVLKSAEQRRPTDLDVLVCLGLAYSKQGQHASALRYFERALARNSGYGAALRGAARAAKGAGNTQKAVEYYQRVLKAEPRNAEARAYVDAQGG